MIRPCTLAPGETDTPVQVVDTMVGGVQPTVLPLGANVVVVVLATVVVVLATVVVVGATVVVVVVAAVVVVVAAVVVVVHRWPVQELLWAEAWGDGAARTRPPRIVATSVAVAARSALILTRTGIGRLATTT